MRLFLRLAGGGLILAALVGCGSSLTGGSVPLGTGTVTGTVSRATAPEETVADVPLTLVASNGQTFTTLSLADGTFLFQAVPSGSARLSVNPQPHQGFRRMQLVLNIGAEQRTEVWVALVPEDAPITVTRLTIQPSQVSLRVGEEQLFRATLQGQNIEGLTPTWIVEGGIGHISPQGMFLAERPGKGRIRALAENAEGAATVMVAGPGGEGPGGR